MEKIENLLMAVVAVIEPEKHKKIKKYFKRVVEF